MVILHNLSLSYALLAFILNDDILSILFYNNKEYYDRWYFQGPFETKVGTNLTISCPHGTRLEIVNRQPFKNLADKDVSKDAYAFKGHDIESVEPVHFRSTSTGPASKYWSTVINEGKLKTG